MYRRCDLPENLSDQLLEVLGQHQPEENQMAWFSARSTEPQPIDEAMRVQGLATYWAEAKVSFAYWSQVSHLDWDKAFRRFLPLVTAAADPAEYYQILSRFASLLHDGHSFVIPPPWVAAREGYPLVRLYPVEGHPAVMDGEGLPAGSVIARIDGVLATDRLAELMSTTPASTAQDRLRRACGLLLQGDVGTFAAVEARLPDGRIVQTELERKPRVELPLLERIDLGAGRVLVRINAWHPQAVVEQFHSAFPHFEDVKVLVIDLRRNPGGNSGFADEVLARLIDRPVLGSRVRIPLYGGSFRSWNYAQPSLTGRHGEVQPDTGRPRFHGPVAVLTSFATYSASEDFCATFRTAKRGLIVGEPTGGSTGQPVLFPLPGGGAGAVCAKETLYADGTPFVGVGILPDIQASPTLRGLAEGRDEVLERALAALA